MNPTTINHSWVKPFFLHEEKETPLVGINAKFAEIKQKIDSITAWLPSLDKFQNKGLSKISEKISELNILIHHKDEVIDHLPNPIKNPLKNFDFSILKKGITYPIGIITLIAAPITIGFSLKKIYKQTKKIFTNPDKLAKAKASFNIIAALGDISGSVGSFASGLHALNLIPALSWIPPLTVIGILFSAASIFVHTIRCYQSNNVLKKVDIESETDKKLQLYKSFSKNIFGINDSLKTKINKEIDYHHVVKNILKSQQFIFKQSIQRSEELSIRLQERVKDHIQESRLLIVAGIISIIGTALLIFASPIGAVCGIGILAIGISLTVYASLKKVHRNNLLETFIDNYQRPMPMSLIGEHRRKSAYRLNSQKNPEINAKPMKLSIESSGKFQKFLNFLYQPGPHTGVLSKIVVVS